MKIILLGYMASGKSTIGKQLATSLNYKFIDLDHYIEEQEEMSITDMFNKKGELYFRKAEKKYLEALLNQDANIVLSLGGGTPCYYSNIETINSKGSQVKSVYINTSLAELTDRVYAGRFKRPLVAQLETKEAVKEYIGKHLFERSFYYNQAQFVVTNNDTAEKATQDIISKLF